MDWTSRLFILLACSIVVISSEDETNSYNPAELLSKIFNPNITSRQRGYGLVKFEDTFDPSKENEQYEAGDRPLRFEDDTRDSNQIKFQDNEQDSFAQDPYVQVLDTPQNARPIKFEDLESGHQGINFQDDNNVGNQNGKKKRKRRRKPKRISPQAVSPGYPGYGYAPMYSGFGYQGPIRRPRRPRPSIATEALSAVTGALTSIARYDDYQCVPRLLCEAAGGGSLGSGGFLDSVAGIQPLLTLLSAYNGISGSPLFVFGRAVFLGMTSKGNTGTCRYAYSQCPTDPEQLIHYLNNYNGGFFRFFSNPQLPNQNVDQFYQQLGQYQNDQNYYNQNPDQYNQFYQNYDSYRPQGYGQQTPSLYESQNNQNYAYGYNNYNNRINNNRIQKRIQNKPVDDLNTDNNSDDLSEDGKFSFPDEYHDSERGDDYNNNDSTLKFPENNDSENDRTRRGKRLNFQNNYSNNKTPKYLNYDQYVTSKPNNNENKYNNNNQKYGLYNYNNNNKYGINNYNDFNKYSTSQIDDDSYNDDYNKHALNNKYNNRYTNNNNNQGNNNNKYGYNNYNQAINNNKYGYNNYNNQGNYNNYNNNQANNNPSSLTNNEDYYFDYKHNFYVKREKNKVPNYSTYSNNNANQYNNYYNNNRYNNNNDDVNGIKTVYIVRGNGDPNNPEIVRVRPGQSVH